MAHAGQTGCFKVIDLVHHLVQPVIIFLNVCRSYKRNLSKYVHHLNTIDTFRDSSWLVSVARFPVIV